MTEDIVDYKIIEISPEDHYFPAAEMLVGQTGTLLHGSEPTLPGYVACCFQSKTDGAEYSFYAVKIAPVP